MTSPRQEPDPEPEPCTETVQKVADDLKSLRKQRIDPLTEPQKGAVEYIERRLRKAGSESEAEKD